MVKEGVQRPAVCDHLARIGERLGWHGALSVDYILLREGESLRYIDCNPRLVEPMSALLAGLDVTGRDTDQGSEEPSRRSHAFGHASFARVRVAGRYAA